MILSYAAMGAEADLTAFHRWAEAAGKRLAFPVTGPGGAMGAWQAPGPEAWRLGRFGIWEPDPRLARAVEPGEIGLVLVPCVGFDRACRRLGRGGGYYDRYLPRCTGAARLGVAFDCQRLPELVPEDPWDVPLQAVVTEKGIYGQ